LGVVAVLRGFGALIVKSLTLLSVQPLPTRLIDVLLLGAGAGVVSEPLAEP
jgi:hypothetical protein